ncbi:MAG: 30S ribosome-binding factor RbfA [Firmicutes bacterium]|jgi:ribosome-binding factor A|nr:30S ribosome-binding factor RbfA [Bacillota bacterium]
MSKQRPQRVAERIKEEVSDILRLEIKDPGLYKMTSVTDVEVSRDLGYAKIYVSVFGDKNEQENILKLLSKASGFIRSELGKRIRLRHIPEVEFRLDRSLEYGAHINKVLKTLNLGAGDDK